VVVETGLGDFSFDWILVQNQVSHFTRICTYDRAGYAWSDPGPMPRTFDQINLELRDVLHKLRERGPFVLVGHSFGGPVVRNFARVYPADVAGIVLVDASHEGLRVGIGGGKTMRLGEFAKDRDIPLPHEEARDSDKPAVRAAGEPQPTMELDPIYKVLPPDYKAMHQWAQSQPSLEDAENSQREWSDEYFGKLLTNPQDGSLGKIPLIVLRRADGGYGNDQDVPGAQLEQERIEGQAKLARLSNNSKQIIIHSGHNMELEAPADVTAAIRQLVDALRQNKSL
jgi:pimeloyl-ACP methyl ester carboxylesterase